MKKIIIMGTFLVVCSAGLFAFGPFGKNRSGHHAANYSIPEGMIISELELTDGVYQGVADGFRPELTVEVEVKGGVLQSVTVVSHNEVGRQYYDTPIKYIPGMIVDKQETVVDSVSGATATSKAIMSAVEDALSKAQINSPE